MKLIISVALTAIATSAPAVALAQQSAVGSVGVRLMVPEYCQVTASPMLTGAGDGMITGSIFESCNTQEGFQVVASHRPLEPNEWIAFGYAGNVRYLNNSGWSEVANRAGAKHGIRPISVRYTSLVAPLAINLTVTMY